MTAQGRILSAPWRNALFALFIGGILAYGAAFAWYMLTRFDLINLIRDVNIDDSFYYFQIARNLAEGKFSTFDGGITRTNGYHPVWMLLITPFYWVFDLETALFGIKAFEIMLTTVAVALVILATRLASLPWILLFAALPLLWQRRVFFGGMESAAALFMLCLLFLIMSLFARNPARWRWPLAAVAFFLPWVRLEYAAISLATAAVLCLIERSWQGPPPVPGASFRARVRFMPALRTVVPFLAACAGILVYFAWNRLFFGGIVPVSGAVRQVWSQTVWEREGGYSFAKNFQDILQLGVFDHELLVGLEVCAYVLLVWWFARNSRSREDRFLLVILTGVFGWSAGHLAKFAQTILTVDAIWGSYAHYFVPAYLMLALIVPVRCWVAVYFIRRFIGPRSPRTANIMSLGIVVAGAVFLLVKTDFTFPFRFVDSRKESLRRSWEISSYEGTRVMNRILPQDSVVGSWSAGVIGYFSRFPVVNLDGVTNSYEYMRALKEGAAARFYRQYGITHFAEVATIRNNPPTMLFEGPPYFHRSGERRFRLWSAEQQSEASQSGFDRSAKLWERMAPSFYHVGASGDIGLIVDGRLTQVVARDCVPDELIVWFWVNKEGRTSDSTTPLNTQTGLCAAVLVLPRHMLPPVRADKMSAGDYLAWLIGDSQPVIRSDFTVYLIDNSLVYVKERCSPEDVEPKFFLHLDPIEESDLPVRRKRYGFDNLDFAFGNHRLVEGRVCVARRPLPSYDIAEIRTGQYADEGRLWEDAVVVAGPGALGEGRH